jgi:hypothetical protein
MAVQLEASPIGTPHGSAVCCWCGSHLVIGQYLQKRCWLCPVDYMRQIRLALIVKPLTKDHAKLLGVPAGTEVCLNVPLPSQAEFEEAQEKNILWGGQAGPGKSHGIRWWLYKRSLTVSKHEALLTRENNEELEKTHIRKMREELPLLGAEFVGTEGRFSNGSFIDCGHMADFVKVKRYLSTEYGVIACDEASQAPTDTEGVTALAELSTRARKVYRDINGVEVRPRFLPVSNPGGPSAKWLCDMFIDKTPDLEMYPAQKTAYDPTKWRYIPARLEDNPYQDPEYEETLANASAVRYEQLRHGDWHVFSGQFFREWSERRHVKAIEVPDGAKWFRSMDWGYNAPGCCFWWAVLADGRLYVRSEVKFQRDDVSVVAAKIQARDRELGITGYVQTFLDPACWAKTGTAVKTKMQGESTAETFGNYKLLMTPGDNDRFNGWMRCHQILRNAPDGEPWLWVHPDCRYLIRSIPAAKSDENDPDDVDTKMDDHALDAWRYGAMSRPSPAVYANQTQTFAPGTMGHLRQSVVVDVPAGRRSARVA